MTKEPILNIRLRELAERKKRCELYFLEDMTYSAVARAVNRTPNVITQSVAKVINDLKIMEMIPEHWDRKFLKNNPKFHKKLFTQLDKYIVNYDEDNINKRRYAYRAKRKAERQEKYRNQPLWDNLVCENLEPKI